ncbi:hypothetical protein IMSHALPRED_000638 [Imshaugia aleurites]|uniref:Uncharacterized protein n=1 Tax=Imshaugia aleurites TaxID=172621 RepID=A0A8H3G4H3_9LECA|nr:hypothetical protein IMSHALPRED_000638 [Imshaugia aleurites]
MSKNENSPPPTPTATTNRRASFSPGQKLSELFGRSPPNGNGTPVHPGPIATAAANAQAQQRRRTSIASLGLAGSPTQASAFTHMRNRQSSIGSGSSPSSSINESAVEEGDSECNTSPSSQFARRMSFGAKALRDVRAGGTCNANGRVSTNASSAPSVKGRGEGFNWPEQIKNRAERSASINSQAPPAPATGLSNHQKAASVAATEQPIKEMPKSPKQPDHFQERILKGDFYMD